MKRVIPSSPFRPAHTWRVVPFHHKHDAIYRSPGLTKLGLTSENAPYANFVELRLYDVRPRPRTGRGRKRKEPGCCYAARAGPGCYYAAREGETVLQAELERGFWRRLFGG